MINGEIYKQAQSLEPEETYTFSFDASVLEYFKTTAAKAGTLVLTFEMLPEDAEVRWADADGRFSSVSIETEFGIWILEAAGVEQGAVCYFYAVGSPSASGKEFTISVEYNGCSLMGIREKWRK